MMKLMLNEKEFKEKVKKAIEFVVDIDEKYKIPSFQVVLNLLLNQEFINESEFLKFEDKSSLKPKLSMVEFINSIEMDTYVDISLGIAFYLWKFESKETFITSDINDSYFKIKMKKPRNVSDTINSLIKKGFIAESDKKEGPRELYITQTGISYIGNKMKLDIK